MSPPSPRPRTEPRRGVVADDRELDRLVAAGARDGQLDRRADIADQLGAELLVGEALDLLIVDAGDDVAGHDAGLGRRRVVDRAHHGGETLLDRIGDADIAERGGAARPGAGVAASERLRIDEIGIFEVGEHAVDGGLHQFAVVRPLHIVGAHLLEGIAEHIEQLIDVRLGDRFRVGAAADQNGLGSDDGEHRTDRGAEQHQ